MIVKTVAGFVKLFLSHVSDVLLFCSGSGGGESRVRPGREDAKGWANGLVTLLASPCE